MEEFVASPETRGKIRSIQQEYEPKKEDILAELNQVELEREAHIKAKDQNTVDNN